MRPSLYIYTLLLLLTSTCNSFMLTPFPLTSSRYAHNLKHPSSKTATSPRPLHVLQDDLAVVPDENGLIADDAARFSLEEQSVAEWLKFTGATGLGES